MCACACGKCRLANPPAYGAERLESRSVRLSANVLKPRWAIFRRHPPRVPLIYRPNCGVVSDSPKDSENMPKKQPVGGVQWRGLNRYTEGLINPFFIGTFVRAGARCPRGSKTCVRGLRMCLLLLTQPYHGQAATKPNDSETC